MAKAAGNMSRMMGARAANTSADIAGIRFAIWPQWSMAGARNIPTAQVAASTVRRGKDEEMEREEEIEGVKRLLEEAGKVLTDIDKKVFEGEDFNVFRLCGVDHYETMHSKILAEFLNPQGSHGQRTLFLECFQKLLKEHFKFKGEFSDRTSVTTEVSFDDGRLDILIEDEYKKSICVIENKIFAGEQSEQLERYSKWLKKQKFEPEKSVLMFLTLNGREAWSIKDQELYQKLAYVSQDKKPCLVDWIDSCLKEIGGEDKTFIQSALKQYKKLVINLATGEQAMSEAIVGVMKGKMEWARIIYDSYEKIKKVIERKLFLEIGEQLSSHGLIIQSEYDVWEGLSATSSQGVRGWGWRLREKKKNKREIWLRVFIEDECQVGVFLPDFVCKKAEKDFVKWCENNRARLEDGRWNVLERPYPLYPLWRTVSGADFPNIEWNARFYDKIETKPTDKPTYRDVVKGAICNNVLLLREELEHFVQENP